MRLTPRKVQSESQLVISAASLERGLGTTEKDYWELKFAWHATPEHFISKDMGNPNVIIFIIQYELPCWLKGWVKKKTRLANFKKII